MVKIPGGKAGSVNRLKKEMEKQRGGSVWIRNVKANEDMTVRFLTEPDEWYRYKEHYSPEVMYFPCIGQDQDCPGCASEDERMSRTSRRFLANALDVDQGRVVPLKLPLDLANRLVARYERYGDTITDRDYILHRMGSGLNTQYDLTPREPQKVDIARYELIDLEESLKGQFEEAFSIEEEKKGDNVRSLRERAMVDTDEDVEVPSEPSTPADEGDDDGFLSEAQALKMSRKELMELAKEYDVKVSSNAKKAEIVDAIFTAAGA